MAHTKPDLQRQIQAVQKACLLLDSTTSPPSLEALAAQVGYSPTHFQRVFVNLTGISPKAYAAGKRSDKLRTLLQSGQSVTDAMYESGYGSPSRLYEHSDARLGMRPSRFQSGGSGERIQFALGVCSLGDVLVAATQKGVCAIDLGDCPEQLLQRLQERFADAELVGGDQAFEQLVANIVGMIDDGTPLPELPLDIRGTAFQEKVWRALRKIPRGQTASYTDIARAIGKPQAVRAVAGACAANTLAVAIPCHRVVRTDGSLSGYRWGVERKAELLQRESAQETE